MDHANYFRGELSHFFKCLQAHNDLFDVWLKIQCSATEITTNDSIMWAHKWT